MLGPLPTPPGSVPMAPEVTLMLGPPVLFAVYGWSVAFASPASQPMWAWREENYFSMSDHVITAHYLRPGPLSEAYRVPDAGQPVGHQGEGRHEEDEDGGPVLRVSVNLPRHSD